MSLFSSYKTPLIIGFVLLSLGSLIAALSIEQPMTEQAYLQTEAAASVSYAQYQSERSAMNLQRGECGYASMDGAVCSMNGYLAPMNWVGLAFLLGGIALFGRKRMNDNSNGIYA